MTNKESGTKENSKPAGFKGIIGVLRPFREWLKITPPPPQVPTRVVIHPPRVPQQRAPSPQVSLPQASPLPQVSPVSQLHLYQFQHHHHLQHSNHNQNHQQQHYQQLQQHQQQQQQQQEQQEQSHFMRSATARMSLPIMQQNLLRRQAYSQLQKRGQLQLQSLGHIYLQHNGETKQANLPNELTALDTIRALFVCAFPNLLTMEYMSQPHVKIYIYNPNCNIFYELHDIEDVRHESVLRIHQSDPVLALQPQYQLRHSFHTQMAPSVSPHPQQQHHQLQQHHSQIIPPPKPRRMVFMPPY